MTSSAKVEAYLQKFLQKFQHLTIQLEEIKKATNDFNDNSIGVGGFGIVYKGEVCHAKGRSMAAIKRLNQDPKKGPTGQGAPEFLKEILMLSDYKHANIISLLGFCCEGGEMILVYEHASRGSLDRYLRSPQLTWRHRLKICLDAAKGLSYLHDPRETRRRLVHCDVKSANILLDDQWNAKISDFGLSTMGSANDQHSVIVTPAAGTWGYIDPEYWMTHTLTKESDVYSLGVVLFEVLCGTLCLTYSDGHAMKSLVPMWIDYYEQNKLNDIIFKDPNIESMHHYVFKRFSGIAYQCLKESREDRPEMADVITKLESALDIHEFVQNEEFIGKWNEQLYEYQEMIKTARPPLNCRSEDELMDLLFKGVLLNDGRTYFLLNKKGEHIEMISIVECMDSDATANRLSFEYNSRFIMGTCKFDNGDENVKVHVRTQFLSPGITYTVNFVFKSGYLENKRRRCQPMYLKYKLQGETGSSVSHLAYAREDGWWICELYQFTCDHRIVHFEILFEKIYELSSDFYPCEIQGEGIEFQPLENVAHVDEKQISKSGSSDANWEEKMPADYEDIIKRSEINIQWTTKEEAYSIIRKGFLISDHEKKNGIWFSLDTNGKKCHMLSANAVNIWASKDGLMFLPESMLLPESRFGKVVQCDLDHISIYTEVPSQLVLFETTYAIYLVYKIPKDQSGAGADAPMQVMDNFLKSRDKIWYIYLVSPQTPVIRPKANQNTHNQPNKLITKGLPQQRDDDWMEVKIWEFQTNRNIDIQLRTFCVKKFSRIIIEGIEFRPI